MEGPVTEGEGMLPPLNLFMAEEEDKKSEFHSNKKDHEEREEEEGKGGGGGLIRSWMSTTVTPLGTRTGEPETEDNTRNEIPKKEVEEGGDVERGGEGGILNNIISNLFHQSDDEQDQKMEGDEEKNKQVKTEEEDSNGGGVIENIVSHLPHSIPDDAVPTADEATILINSLVRD